jgi:hypothetical protein
MCKLFLIRDAGGKIQLYGLSATLNPGLIVKWFYNSRTGGHEPSKRQHVHFHASFRARHRPFSFCHLLFYLLFIGLFVSFAYKVIAHPDRPQRVLSPLPFIHGGAMIAV